MARRKNSTRTEDVQPSPGSSEAMEFRKTNDSIGLRVKEGRLSLLSRKLYNVMVYHAQQLKVPGQNAPIATAAAKKYFWIPLADVARDAAYDSNDTELLKHHLEEFQNIKIHIEDDQQWTSERLVSSVKLVNPLGLKKRGGMVWFGFAFPPEVHELVMSPGTYTKLSIYYQGLLRSGPALALYEICRRYATNPSRVTSIEIYEYWHSALTGNPVRDEPPAYKYFKRDVLKPAIAEINSTTDIEVDLIEHKNGRKVERLQFYVELKKQQNIAFPAPPLINSEIIGKLITYGFSQQEATDLTAQYSDEKIQAAILMVDSRLESKNSPPLDSTVAYFRWSLKQGVSAAKHLLEKKVKPTKEAKKTEQPKILDKFLAARSKSAFSAFQELDADTKREVFERFKEKNNGKGVQLDKGTDSPLVRTMLSQWYANELWGEPTAEALASYVEQLDLPESS